MDGYLFQSSPNLLGKSAKMVVFEKMASEIILKKRIPISKRAKYSLEMSVFVFNSQVALIIFLLPFSTEWVKHKDRVRSGYQHHFPLPSPR